MSKYINDPREMAIVPESGVTYEEDNRVEKMYHWGAKVLDLCGMEISEYMKPMTVIIGDDPTSGGTGTTKVNVSVKVSVISPEGDILDKDGNVIGTTQGDGTWKVRWTWNKNFDSILASSVSVSDNNSNEYTVNANIETNQGTEFTSVINGVSSDASITSIGTCTIGTSQSTATGSTVVIDDKIAKKEYDIEITPSSGEEPVLDGDIYYSFIPKSSEPSFDTMDNTTALSAKGDGVEFTFHPAASPEFIEEAYKYNNGISPYDDDETMEEIWEEFVETYENANRYVFRMYIPTEIEDIYNYNLYNDNAGILIPATFVKTGAEKSYNGVVYSEYINEDDSYLYDDDGNREFTLRFIISEK
jgi:hypothetical protein